MYARHEENRHETILMILFVAALVISRYFWGIEAAARLLTLSVLTAMLWCVRDFEKQNKTAANGFAVMVTGTVYFGWVGGYLISLRQLENGSWWVIVCVLLVWISDSGAFLVGSLIGKHRMLPLVSPHKTWEGYLGGILTALLFSLLIIPLIPPISSLMSGGQMTLLAILISSIGQIGDFGASMIKRTFKVKDSSNLIPGHGGFFDRLDTVLWALPIGYLFYELLSAGLLQL